MTMFYRTSSANAYDTAVRNITHAPKCLVRFAGEPDLRQTCSAPQRRPNQRRPGRTRPHPHQPHRHRPARAGGAAQLRFEVAESTLGSVTDAMQRFRELVVSAGNGVQQQH
jgi:flagellar hook-associated protein 3 FlgL